MGRIRAQKGLTGDWLFLQTDQRPAVCWQAYDPAADRWHPLPPAPGFSPGTRHSGFRCVILHSRLLVLGGCRIPFPDELSCDSSTTREQPSNRVLCFDPFLRRWSELPGMKTPRIDFACAAVHNRVIVAGGEGGGASAESFDLRKNTWETLPEMPEPLQGCRAVTHDGQFHVLGYSSDGLHRHFIFNAEWMAAPPDREFPLMAGIETGEMGGRLYGILYEGLAELDDSTGEWRVLGEPPLCNVPGHDRRLPPSGAGFMGLKGRLYVVGGVGVRYDVETRVFTIVKFSTTQYCNLSGSTQIRWQGARPLFGACGAVLACAALQQE